MEIEPDKQSAPTKHLDMTYTISKPQITDQHLEDDDCVIVIPDTPSPVFSRFVGRKDRSSLQNNSLNGMKRNSWNVNGCPRENHSNLLSCNEYEKRKSINNRHSTKYFDNDVTGQSSVKSLKTTKDRLKDNNPVLYDYLLGQNREADSKGYIGNSSGSSKGYMGNSSGSSKEFMGNSSGSQSSSEIHINKSSDLDSGDVLGFLYGGNSEQIAEREGKSKGSSSFKSLGIKDELQNRDNQRFGRAEERNSIFVEKEVKNTFNTDVKYSGDKMRTNSSGVISQSQHSSKNTADQLRKERNKKLNRYFESSDSLSSEEYMELPSPSRHDLSSSRPRSRTSHDQRTNKKFKFDTLHWPSDSDTDTESDSDNDDNNVPLKELIYDNSTARKKKLFRNSQGKVNQAESPTSTNTSFADEIGAMDRFLSKSPKVKNSKNPQNSNKSDRTKYFSSPKLSKKSASASTSGQPELNSNNIQGIKSIDSRRQNLFSRPETNVPKNSGTVSLNPHHKLSKIPESNTCNSDNSIICIPSTNSPDPNTEDIHFDDSMDIEFDLPVTPSDSSSTFRAPFISPRVPVPNSVRRGTHVEWRGRQERPEEGLSVDHIQPPVSPRDPLSMSPYMLGRSRTSRSHKGRHSRVRNMSRERVSTHSTDFTTATSLLTPRSRDTAQLISQQQTDEDYARRLQEEMDMEFAMSLHNMENQPPPEYPAGGATGDSGTPITDVENERSQQTRARMFGLEDIEAYIHHPENSPGSLEMLRASMVTTPPRMRSRTRASRRQRLNSNQSLNNSLEALNRMEAHLMSIIDRSSTVAGRNRRGGRFFRAVPSVGDGQDYEELLNLAEMMGEVKKRGLSKNQVTKLPERTYQTVPGEDAKECHICMCEFESKEILRILPCFHEFHTPCIDKWIVENATCPVCRVEVSV